MKKQKKSHYDAGPGYRLVDACVCVLDMEMTLPVCKSNEAAYGTLFCQHMYRRSMCIVSACVNALPATQIGGCTDR